MNRTSIPQRLASTLLNSLATVDILHDFRSYLASLCLSSPSFSLAFREHIADGKILIISAKVMVINRSWTEDLRVVTYPRAICQALDSAGMESKSCEGWWLPSKPFCFLIGRRKGPYWFMCFWNLLQDWLVYVYTLTPTNQFKTYLVIFITWVLMQQWVKALTKNIGWSMLDQNFWSENWPWSWRLILFGAQCVHLPTNFTRIWASCVPLRISLL